MDDLNTHANLFSRGVSPPPHSFGLTAAPMQQQQQQQQQQQAYTPQQQAPMPQQQQNMIPEPRELSPPHSLRAVVAEPAAVPNPLDSLFQHLNAPAPQDPAIVSAAPGPSSAPGTPMSSATVGTTASAPTGDRQHALLSLLGTVASPPVQQQPQPQPFPVQQNLQQSVQQIPMPPGSTHQFASPPPPAAHDSPARTLLDQLMSGSAGAGRTSFGSPTHSLHAPSPPYGVSPYQPLAPTQPQQQQQQQQQQQHIPLQHQPLPQPPQQQFELEQHYLPEPYPPLGPGVPQARDFPQVPLIQHQPPVQPQQQQVHQPVYEQQQQQQAPPSPKPRPMFEFVSPFDAFSGGNASAGAPSGIKKKPVPPLPQPPVQDEGLPWPAQESAQDSKRRSVDNMLEQLTRGQPAPGNAPSQDQYDAYLAGDALQPPPPLAELDSRVVAPAQAPPLPKPPQQQQQRYETASPRGSPPKPAPQQPAVRPQPRPIDNTDSFTSAGAAAVERAAGRRAKESSPGPRGAGWKDGKKKARNVSVGAPAERPPQTLVLDVSSPLEEIQAPKDCVKYTAIALVKVESSFLPGTTIGATHWVAYAMSKGRVRVISRSSGDRTLLQLPPTFPPTAVVSDMAVYGNRLAGVTSDGGFVVWELPEVITDDVPGKILLCVYPSPDIEPLQSVKWHPKQPDSLAVASESKIYLLNIVDADQTFAGAPIAQTDLQHVGAVFAMPSALVAFDFDVHHFALGTIAADSTLTLWSIRDKTPFWAQKIRGDDVPSSVAFIDGGVILGRRNGTVFQLLPVMSRVVSATVRLAAPDDAAAAGMFGRANYDARIQTLWIATNTRESLFGLRLGFEPVPAGAGEDEHVRPFVEQAVEFGGVKPTIHFVILTADADPSGEEAEAACVAAKVPVGELALVAFSVHSSGVDQILIRREWYDHAFGAAPAKFPFERAPAPAVVAPLPAQRALLARARTPPSEDLEPEPLRDEGRVEARVGKASKQKNVGWKEREREREQREKEELSSGKEKPAPAPVAAPPKVEPLPPQQVPQGQPPPPVVQSAQPTEAVIGAVFTKEMKKLEENLNTRLGRLVGKELDKQQSRMEDLRATEQAAEVARQEKLMKLISQELTKNTTRVVESAVKSEVMNSVLPALENITKSELKAAMGGNLTKSLSDALKQHIPGEVERAFTRMDITTNLARAFSSSLAPTIERHVKDALGQTIVPNLTAQAAANHQELMQYVHGELDSFKLNMAALHGETVRSQEGAIRDLEQIVRKLSEQVKFLTMGSSPHIGARASPSSHPQPAQQPQSGYAAPAPPYPSQLRQAPINAPQSYAPAPQQQQFAQAPLPPPPANAQAQWYQPPMVAPQASHPTLPPPVAPAPQLPAALPPRQEEWDDAYLHVLHQESLQQLQDLLSRSDPDAVMPLNAPVPLSQAVVLTLIHRLSTNLGEVSPMEDAFATTIWWLQRSSLVLDTTDPLVASYIPRVLPQVQQSLNSTRQRLSILPGAPPHIVDAARSISDVQATLGRKPALVQ